MHRNMMAMRYFRHCGHLFDSDGNTTCIIVRIFKTQQTCMGQMSKLWGCDSCFNISNTYYTFIADQEAWEKAADIGHAPFFRPRNMRSGFENYLGAAPAL